MAFRVVEHPFGDACLFLGFFDCPLDSTLRISGIKISAYTADNLLIFVVEYSFVGLFCLQIALQSRDKNICQRNIAIFLVFTFLHMSLPCKLAPG
jgi:hypothetical protein